MRLKLSETRSHIEADHLTAGGVGRERSRRHLRELWWSSTTASLRVREGSSAFWSKPYSGNTNLYSTRREVLQDTEWVQCCREVVRAWWEVVGSDVRKTSEPEVRDQERHTTNSLTCSDLWHWGTLEKALLHFWISVLLGELHRGTAIVILPKRHDEG